jgi:DNA-binding MarR family transcriptional regulator
MTNLTESADSIAREVLDVIPLMMHVIRTEMRSQRSPDLTVPQFRALLFLSRSPGCSLFSLAEHLGLTSPTVCKMVDGLVQNNLVNRESSAADRRKVILSLTARGRASLEKARIGAQARLAAILSPLGQEERYVIWQALKLLQPLFLQHLDPNKAVPVKESNI